MFDWDTYWRNIYNEWATPIQLGILDKWCQNTQSDIEFLEIFLKGNKLFRILDISCGWGRHAIELKKLDYEVFGLDFSFSLLKLAKTASKLNKISLPLIAANRRTLWCEEMFDVILQMYDAPWTSYWETYEDHLDYLQRIYRALKPGGYFIAGTTDYQFDKEETISKEKKQMDQQGIKMLENLVSEDRFNHYSYQKIQDLFETTLFGVEVELNQYDINSAFQASQEGYVLVSRAMKTTVEIWVFSRNPDMEVLLLRRTKKSGWGKVFWQPITGTININESPVEAAVRELAEESGITSWKHWIDMKQPFYFPTRGLGTLHKTLYAVEVEKQDIVVDPHEHDAFQWVPLDKVSELLYWNSNIKGFGLFKSCL